MADSTSTPTSPQKRPIDADRSPEPKASAETNVDFPMFLPSTNDKDPHYDATDSVPKRMRVDEEDKTAEDDYHSALMDLNDTEQLQFLADQLKPADVRSAHDVTSPRDSHMSGQDSMVVGERDLGFGGAYSTTLTSTTYADLAGLDGRASDPLFMLRIKSLPILDNLSTQILNTLGRGAYMDAIAIATQPETDQGQAFQILMSLFEQTKTIYCDDAFLSAKGLNLSNPREHGVIIQKTNLATFVSAVFGAAKVGFFHLNENFLDTFVVENGRLLKPQGALFLDLKTQAYISAMGQVERSQKEILDDLFPDDMDKILLARKTNSKILAPSESDFVARCRRRRDHLAAMDPAEDISGKYSWLAFVRDLSEYISKNSQMILSGKSSRSANGVTVPGEDPDMAKKIPRGRRRLDHESPQPEGQDIHRGMSGISMVNGSSEDLSAIDFALVEGRPSTSDTSGSAVAAATYAVPTSTPAAPAQPRAPYYQRRPWTQEEEEALMSGLNTVQGPHWSQILELYGAGGRISEVLKDRNQVQLKDKARNLKLFFLKTGVKMPEVLRFVTGDVRTREKSAKRTRKNHAAKTQQQREAVRAQMYQEQQQQQQHQQQQLQQQQQQQGEPIQGQPQVQAAPQTPQDALTPAQQPYSVYASPQEPSTTHQVPTPVPVPESTVSQATDSSAHDTLFIQADDKEHRADAVAEQTKETGKNSHAVPDHTSPAGQPAELVDTSVSVSATAVPEHEAPVNGVPAGEGEVEDESANLLTLMQQVGEYLDSETAAAEAAAAQNDMEGPGDEPKEWLYDYVYFERIFWTIEY